MSPGSLVLAWDVVMRGLRVACVVRRAGLISRRQIPRTHGTADMGDEIGATTSHPRNHDQLI